MTTRTLAVVTAGLSQPSSSRLLADRLAAAVREELAGHGVRSEIRLIELRDHAHDIVNALVARFPSGPLKEVVDAVTGADGLIVVTPIFNASYSGLFKSFFDVFTDGALAGKPVLAAATGGTARHSLALEYAVRPMFSYLRAIMLPTAVFAAPQDWAGAGGEGALGERIRRAARELADQVRRQDGTPPADPFALTKTFDQLLAGD